MEYLVKSITPKITSKTEKAQVAAQIQELIAEYSEEGYEYVGIEHLSTVVPPTEGCFGLGSSPGYQITVQLIIFKK